MYCSFHFWYSWWVQSGDNCGSEVYSCATVLVLKCIVGTEALFLAWSTWKLFFPSERCIWLLLLRDGYAFYLRLWNVLFRGFEYRSHFDFLLWKLLFCGFILLLLLKKAAQQTNKSQKKSLKVSVSIFLKNALKMKVREIKLIFWTGTERRLLYRLAFEGGFLCVQYFSLICLRQILLYIHAEPSVFHCHYNMQLLTVTALPPKKLQQFSLSK